MEHVELILKTCVINTKNMWWGHVYYVVVACVACDSGMCGTCVETVIMTQYKGHCKGVYVGRPWIDGSHI